MSVPVDNTLCVLSCTAAGRIVHVCDSTGRGHPDAYAWLFLGFAPYVLSLADFNQYPVAVINCNCEIPVFLIPVGPFSESPSLVDPRHEH